MTRSRWRACRASFHFQSAASSHETIRQRLHALAFVLTLELRVEVLERREDHGRLVGCGVV